jgi:NAD(P)H-flavin reductase/hemoglobin-like flavoprotein
MAALDAMTMSDDFHPSGPVQPELTPRDLIMEIRASFALIQPHDAAAAAWFYEHFLTVNPRYRKYFSNDPAVVQRRLFLAVERIVADLDRLDVFLPYLRRLALRHRKFGLKAAHYQAFGVSLLATVREFTGDRWTEQTEVAWEAGYGMVSSVMLAAVAEADETTPPYWDAEVIGHQPMAAGIAQVTLRLRQSANRPGPYVFRAGQYAALETAGLVRTWRDFSFSGAPKAADEVEFQIQAGRAGGVSDVLVNGTAIGDRVRIAAAEGDLAFPEADRCGRLLAVAHGTGAAPILALAQAAAEAGDLRPLTVILVTEGEPHYLTRSFQELAAAHGGLAVEEVVGDPLAAVRTHAIAAGEAGGTGGLDESAGRGTRGKGSNGVGSDGPRSYGASVNGHSVNGQAVNGHSANGQRVSGRGLTEQDASDQGVTGLGAVLVGPSTLVESCRTALIRAGVSADEIASDLFD